MKISLSRMKRGQCGYIAKLEIESMKRRIHLLEMGLTIGTKIKLKKIAPTGGTVCIELRGYELCIGTEDAKRIMVTFDDRGIRK